MTDRELDALVAERVMGWKKGPGSWWLDSEGKEVAICHPSRSYHEEWSALSGDGMLAVVEAMRDRDGGEKWNKVRMDMWNDGTWRVMFAAEPYTKSKWAYRRAYGEDASLPRAVCLAALKALGVKVS